MKSRLTLILLCAAGGTLLLVGFGLRRARADLDERLAAVDARQLRLRQVGSSEPLTHWQANEMIRTLASASPTYAKGGTVDVLDVDWSATDSALRRILSPAQLAAWQTGAAENRQGVSLGEVRLLRAIEAAVKPPPN